MRQFLKQTFASLVGSLAGLILFFGLGTSGLIFLIIAVASRDDGPQVKDKSVLVFNLAMTITDTDPTLSTTEAIGEVLGGSDESRIALLPLLDTIDKATKDPRITALYLDGTQTSTGPTAGLATLKEVREALARFQAADKQIIAYDVDLGEQEYYLTSLADKVILNPAGAMEVNGFSSQPLFFAGALEKFGIGVQIIRVGQYKAAVEPFTLKQMSPENRQQMEKLLGSLWYEFIATVGKSRELTPTQLQEITNNQGLLMADEALEKGLVDQLSYQDEVVTELKALSGRQEEDESFRQISLASYSRVSSQQSETAVSDNKIAVVYAEGEIVSGEGGVNQVGGESLARQLRELRQDKAVKAVVLRVNSPGGSATASEVIEREVRLTQKEKPVIVSMGDFAASGGYWIVTGADYVFAEPNTVTGSIGVFGLLPNVQELANNNGITWDVVKTGRYADSQTVSRPKTPQELAIAQKAVNKIYDQFLEKVANARKLPKQQVAQIAQGRVWSGRDAHKIGLVDELGGVEQAVQYAAKQAKLGDDWELQESSESGGFESRFLKRLAGEESTQAKPEIDPITAEFEKFKADLEVLQTMNDPRGVYARLPFNWRME